jgi:hypothetical protein
MTAPLFMDWELVIVVYAGYML